MPNEDSFPATDNLVQIEPLPLQILSRLEGVFRHGAVAAEITGGQSWLGFALLLSQQTSEVVKRRPNVVVVETDDLAEQIKEAIHFFDPLVPVHILPAYDVGPYDGLYPSNQRILARLAWLNAAQNARPGEVFLATLGGLLQRTLPFPVLHENAIHLQTGDTVDERLFRRLESLGYSRVPLVEDQGSFSSRGAVFDVFSPGQEYPYRLELFGDRVESLRVFDPESQRSLGTAEKVHLVPAREVLYLNEEIEWLLKRFNASLEGRSIDPVQVQTVQRSLARQQHFHGAEFFLPYFYRHPACALDHFSEEITLWLLEPHELTQAADSLWHKRRDEFLSLTTGAVHVPFQEIYLNWEGIPTDAAARTIGFARLRITDERSEPPEEIEWRASGLQEFRQGCLDNGHDPQKFAQFVAHKISDWRQKGFAVFIASHTQNQAQRLQTLLEKVGYRGEIAGISEYRWFDWIQDQTARQDLLHIIPRALDASERLNDEKIIFLREDDFFGRKKHRRTPKSHGTLASRTHALSFGDLHPGDAIVHRVHGIGIYDGLKLMQIHGVETEFIQLRYRDDDRLYLPIYRIGQIQKFSGPTSPQTLDKLGGTGWQTTTAKVKKQVRDLAAELLSLYAQQAQVHRPAFSTADEAYEQFSAQFPFEETDDQLRVIEEVLKDLSDDHPMDRLVCGDVGFGKTEVAMRAAFKVVEDGKQVALIAPTTILTFQHLQTFRRRFSHWPLTIKALNRFVPAAETKKTLAELKSGQIQIIIGTHRLLSKDVGFHDLGLLIIDEEHKFGVKQKEQIRKLKLSVDTLALSATPIPRSLNLSLVGVRDLSIITTPPMDRLPTRTFVTRFDHEAIRRAITAELQRGGQVFFLHNRVQDIELVASEIRQIVPQARLAIGHGQMREDLLEKTMVQFFQHEIDILVSTTIIESGMDIPNANTILINNAHQLGLSQLYQLRGRVGRGKERAYCYLLIPPGRVLDEDAQTRLKVIQEHTALGSGVQVAQYDLELRGAGDILGAEQSGHINAIGYELYIELLEAAIEEQKGLPPKPEEVEPEINVPIPALIPDRYMPDIRLRLAYYKQLAEITSEGDLDRIEEELRDQFGPPPEPVINLMGLMLVRRLCRKLGLKDLSAGRNSISLRFSENTLFPAAEVVRLTSRENKKYSVSPDSRLKIRMNQISWPRILDELQYLDSLTPRDPTY